VTYFADIIVLNDHRWGSDYLISTTTSRTAEKPSTSHTYKLNKFLSQNQLTFHRENKNKAGIVRIM
jgi:hypothetical protein